MMAMSEYGVPSSARTRAISPAYPRGLLLGVVRGIADDRVPLPNAVHSFLGLRPWLLAMTALAASRMVCVER